MRQVGERVFQYLVIAVLSVNNYRVEQAWMIKDGLNSARLFSPEHLAELGVDRIEQLLVGAGFNRGAFMARLFAERLHSIGRYIIALGTSRAARVLESGNDDEVGALLLPAKGIGPVVVENFLLLRGSAPQPKKT